MITIRYKCDEAHELKISGHAGYAEKGKDIVCAGVSAITYALLGIIDADYISRRIADGNVYIRCENNSERIGTAFDMAIIGYEQIAHTHPDNVSVQILPQQAADSGE